MSVQKSPISFPFLIAAVLSGGHSGPAIQGHGKSSRSPYDGSQHPDWTCSTARTSGTIELLGFLSGWWPS